MILAVFACYLLGMLAIGVYSSRYNKDIGDFVLAGRRLGPWVAAFSAQASDFSGWLLIGLPAMAYARGFSIIWACIGCTCGVMFNWVVLAPRLRRLSEAYDALTIPDLLEARFADRTHVIRVLAVLIIVVYYISYVSAQFNATGKVFASAFGQVGLPWGEKIAGVTLTHYHQGLLIGAAIILGYTTLGGFLAVCWTDFVQALLMVSAVVLVPVVGVIHLGGLSELWSAMAEGALHDAMLAIDGGQAGASFVFGVAIYGLAWMVGYPGQPHIIARFMAIQEPRKIPQSALISMVWTVLALYGAAFVGFVALGVLGPDLGTGKATDQAMPLLALKLLPTFFAGLVLSAAVAAMMSTVDSQIIVAVAAVVRDGYEKLLGGHPSDRTAVWLSRVVVLIVGVGGVIMAWEQKKVFLAVLDAWGGLAAGLGPAIVLGCFWRRTSRIGVIVGMVAGVAVVQGWWPLMKGIDRLADAALAATVDAKTLATDIANNVHATKLVTTVLMNLLFVVILSLLLRAKPENAMALGRSNRTT
jgi:sodium/proline symporter